MCVTLNIRVCCTTRSPVHLNSLHFGEDYVVDVLHLRIHMCDTTYSYVWNESFICVTWLISSTYSTYVFIRVTRHIHTCDTSHSYVWHDSFSSATKLIYTRDMTHSYVWHSSLSRAYEWSPLSCRLFCTGERAISFSMEKSPLSFRWLARQCKIVDTMARSPVHMNGVDTMVSTIVSTILHWRASHRHDSRDFSIENEMARSPVKYSRHHGSLASAKYVGGVHRQNSRHESGEVSTIVSTILSMYPTYLFICITWLTHTYDLTRSYVSQRHDSFIRVPWLIHTCAMTHSYVCHDSFIRVPWLIHIGDMSRVYVWHASLPSEIIHLWSALRCRPLCRPTQPTCSNMRQNISICVKWLRSGDLFFVVHIHMTIWVYIYKRKQIHVYTTYIFFLNENKYMYIRRTFFSFLDRNQYMYTWCIFTWHKIRRSVFTTHVKWIIYILHLLLFDEDRHLLLDFSVHKFVLVYNLHVCVKTVRKADRMCMNQITTRVRLHVCGYVHIYIYMYVVMYICMYVDVNTYMHEISTGVRIHVYGYVHIYICIYIYMYVYRMCMHIYVCV